MNRLFAKIATFSGWPRLLIAIILGELAAFGLPPAGLWPVTVVAFTGLPLLVPAGTSARQAAVSGFGFAFGWFTLGLYWISFALFADGTMDFVWLVPLALFGLPAVLALFWAAAFWGWGRLVKNKRGIQVNLALAAAIMLAEYARGHMFTGFPWNLPAIVLLDSGFDYLAAYGGIYLLSLLFLAMMFVNSSGRRLAHVCVLLLAVIGFAGGKYEFFGDTDVKPSDTDSVVKIRIVQPSIPMADKLADRKAGRERLLVLTSAPGNPQLIIWPETAFSYRADDSPAELARIRNAMPPGSRLLAGATRWTGDDESLQVANTLTLLGDGNWPPKAYLKAHLVPFGEYIPFARWLPIKAIAGDLIPYSAGPGPEIMHLTWEKGETDGSTSLSVIPMICYEAIFPNVVTSIPPGPAVIVNVTNDAWYGRSAGPFQHLAQARFRAIELGVPMIRAANNGISAVIDNNGRVIRSLSLDSVGFIDFDLPISGIRPAKIDNIIHREMQFLGVCIMLLSSLFLGNVIPNLLKNK